VVVPFCPQCKESSSVPYIIPDVKIVFQKEHDSDREWCVLWIRMRAVEMYLKMVKQKNDRNETSI